MGDGQLPLFQRKRFKGIIPALPIEIQAPMGAMTVLQALPAYYTYLKGEDLSKYTPDDFTGDVKKFGVFLQDRLIKDITKRDVQAWISLLKSPSPKGEGLSAKTVSRKLTALSNFFNWLAANEVLSQQANPMLEITNTRVSSPLPEILFEEECGRLLAAASEDPRTYLLLILLLETGIKLEELLALKVSSFDFSNQYSPEMDIRHAGKKEKKSRKLKLQPEIIPVFTDYMARYKVGELLFPYSRRFVRYLLTATAARAGVKKQVSAQILRDTCAVRQLRRGEAMERVLLRLGLSETTWEDAKVKYL